MEYFLLHNAIRLTELNGHLKKGEQVYGSVSSA